MKNILKITLTKNLYTQIICNYLSFSFSLLLLSLFLLCFSIFPQSFTDNILELFLGVFIFLFMLISSYNSLKTIRKIQKFSYILKIDSVGFHSPFSSVNLISWSEISSLEICHSQSNLKQFKGCYFQFLNISTKSYNVVSVPYSVLLPVGYTTQTYTNLLHRNFKMTVCTTFSDVIEKNNIEIIYDDIDSKGLLKSKH